MQGWLWMMTVGLLAMNPLIRHRDTVLGTDTVTGVTRR
jgi:hypothetical protein